MRGVGLDINIGAIVLLINIFYRRARVMDGPNKGASAVSEIIELALSFLLRTHQGGFCPISSGALPMTLAEQK